MKIRKRKNPSGEIVYQLDLGRDKAGKRVRRTFETMAKAKQEMQLEIRRRGQHGRMIDEISPEEMAEMVTARARLRAVDATISEAVEFFMTHGRRILEPLKLSVLMERFRRDRENLGLSDAYVSQLGTSLRSLCRMYPDTMAHELTQKMVRDWNASEKWQPKTRNNYLGDVSAMFEWAILPIHGHARINPCVGLMRAPKKRRGQVATCTVEQVEQMLNAAVAEERWWVLAFVVLGAFGGLRPEAEAADQKLTWKDINLAERTVRLTEEVVKTGPGRVVDLTENAVAWLELIPEKLRSGPVVPSRSWDWKWLRFRYLLGWDVATEKTIRKRCLPAVEAVHGEWPNDVLRHTFASMHYAEHQNEALLQVQMGHRSAKMIHEHYRAVRTRVEAKRFWALRPAAVEPVAGA